MAVVYLVQHGEKEKAPGDPGLAAAGREQAATAARWLGQTGLTTLYSSPLRRAQETAGYLPAGLLDAATAVLACPPGLLQVALVAGDAQGASGAPNACLLAQE